MHREGHTVDAEHIAHRHARQCVRSRVLFARPLFAGHATTTAAAPPALAQPATTTCSPAHHSIDRALSSHPTHSLLLQPRSADAFSESPLPIVAWEGGTEIVGGGGGLIMMKIDELSVRMLTYLDEAGIVRCMAATTLAACGSSRVHSSVKGFKMLNEQEIKEHLHAGQICAGDHLATLLWQPRPIRSWLRGSQERVACPSLKAPAAFLNHGHDPMLCHHCTDPLCCAHRLKSRPPKSSAPASARASASPRSSPSPSQPVRSIPSSWC